MENDRRLDVGCHRTAVVDFETPDNRTSAAVFMPRPRSARAAKSNERRKSGYVES